MATDAEMKTLVGEEARSLDTYLESEDYTNSLADAKRETGWATFTTDFREFWIKMRMKRHLFSELKSLYMDKFDYRSGRFTGMTEKSKKEFEQDMGTFYKAFTNKSTAPPNLSNFDNIPLMDYHNQPPCHTPDGFLVQQFAYDPTSPLYKTYAEHLGKMKTNATAGQENLSEY